MSNEMAAAARASPLLLLVLALVAAHVPLPVRAQDTVAAGRPLSGDAKLVSRGGKFALGFFQPGIYHTHARVVPMVHVTIYRETVHILYVCVQKFSRHSIYAREHFF